ncbi:MAG: apolipoprotein N-acyltransferase [Gammaproteobacteria bacterium RIFCSPHIGHO2_12_FULL_42_10]|nr:MAG: apolipoprotein N-acyltransferase [Gammaproteobacteria bacterium RIFCSPHIGHO2_12_FULL_42_10]
MRHQINKNEIAMQAGQQRDVRSLCGRTAIQMAIVFILGISLSLAFAPYSICPLAILAPAGLLAFMQNTTPKRAGQFGFTFGMGFFSVGTYWLFISIHHFGEVPVSLAGLIVFLFVAILACFPALSCYLTNRYYPNTSPTKLILAFPAIWVIIEWARSWVGDGFPWLLLGYSQTHTPLQGFAPLLSVYGVSLATLMTSGLVLNAWINTQQKNYRALYLSLFGITALWISGALLSLITWTHPHGKPLTVSLVQGNISQSLKWSPEHLNLSIERYTELTRPFWSNSNLIVWPEAAIPFSLQDAAPFIDTMDQAALTNHTHLALGIPVENSDKTGYYNAIVTLGHTKSIYLKRRLVPFGEYIPLASLFAHVLDFMHIPLPNMQNGNPIQKPLMIDNIKINASICFEIAFPELIRTRAKDISFLLSLTNDAWFGQSSAQALHLQMAEMRAIELGRPLLFTSNNGLTAIIGPQGNITNSIPPDIAAVLHGTVQPMFGQTPWAAFGMDPLLILLFCFLLIAKNTCLEILKTEINGSCDGKNISPSNA